MREPDFIANLAAPANIGADLRLPLRKSMTSSKPLLYVLALLASSAASSNGTVLFTDNFDATSNQTPNDQIDNPGRQGGSLATLGYIQAGNVQIGNDATLPPSPGNDPGDEFLAAFAGRAWVNHDFSGQTLPLEITFSALISSISNTGTDNWISFSVGNGTAAPFVNDANVASILFRANGETEVWNHGINTPGGTSAAPGFDVWSDYKIVLSDTAGTGSAFGSGGSRADYYFNGTFLGTLDIDQLTSGDGYFGFASDRIVGYDNLSISTVPEPASAVLGLAGMAGLLLTRRRK